MGQHSFLTAGESLKILDILKKIPARSHLGTGGNEWAQRCVSKVYEYILLYAGLSPDRVSAFGKRNSSLLKSYGEAWVDPYGDYGISGILEANGLSFYDYSPARIVYFLMANGLPFDTACEKAIELLSSEDWEDEYRELLYNSLEDSAVYEADNDYIDDIVGDISREAALNFCRGVLRLYRNPSADFNCEEVSRFFRIPAYLCDMSEDSAQDRLYFAQKIPGFISLVTAGYDMVFGLSGYGGYSLAAVRYSYIEGEYADIITDIVSKPRDGRGILEEAVMDILPMLCMGDYEVNDYMAELSGYRIKDGKVFFSKIVPVGDAFEFEAECSFHSGLAECLLEGILFEIGEQRKVLPSAA